MKFISILTVLFLFGTSSAHALDSEKANRAEVCDPASVFVAGGGEAGLEKLSDMFAWNENSPVDIKDALSILMKYGFDDVHAYAVSDFGELAEDNLLVLSISETGTVYLHISFQRIDGQLRAANVHLSDSIKSVTDARGPFPMPPAKIDC